MTTLADQLQFVQVEEQLDSRRVLLLWFIRNALGVEELDAYEYIFEQPEDVFGFQVDAAFVSDPEIRCVKAVS